MFQFKNGGMGVKQPSTSTTLPNSRGKVRTFKEDSENFGKAAPVEDLPETKNILPPEKKEPTAQISVQKQDFSPMKPTVAPIAENIPANNPFQSVPTPPPISSPNPNAEELPAFKSSPSQSFFAEKTPVQQEILPENKDIQATSPPPQKRGFVLYLLVFLFLIVLAGAGSYYWLFIRNNPTGTSQSSSSQVSVPSQETPAALSETENKNLRRLAVDTSQGPTEVKNVVERLAAEFAGSSAQNDLVEVKIVGKDGLPVGKKDFFSSFQMTVPEKVLMKLSEEYSLFVRKEGSGTKLGLVFKTVTSAGLPEEMKNWEPDMPKNIEPLFFGQPPVAGSGSFNSSRYKNADIRYFNFSSPIGDSIDYSIISNFLVIGTSRDCARAILDYMSEK